MKFDVTLNLDNEAFKDAGELSRILRELADKVNGIDLKAEELSAFDRRITCHDVNGNTVGVARFLEHRWLPREKTEVQS